MQLGFIRNSKIIQIKEIAEIPVMPDSLCTPPPPPPTHTHTVPSATTLWDTFIITFFLGRHFTCPPCANDKWDKGIMEAHPKAFASTRLH